MQTKFTLWVRQHPVLAFYILAFAITWAGWLPQVAYSHGLFPFDSPLFYLLGGVGPMAAAYIILYVLHGKEATEKLFAPLLRWKVGAGWYVAALVVPTLIWLGTLAWRGELGLVAAKFAAPFAVLASFLTYLIAAIPEETAWRGFVLPRLQVRFSALAASLVVGVLGALWHLPLLFIKGSVMASYPLLPFLLEGIFLTVLYSWVFNSTQGSALLTTLFHAAVNVTGPFAGIENTVMVFAAVAVVVVVCGGKTLRWPGRSALQKASAQLL